MISILKQAIFGSDSKVTAVVETSFSEARVARAEKLEVKFTKMSGAGNDFVVIDNQEAGLSLSTEEVARLCDRHFGVGADGVLLVEKGPEGVDYKMVYYNADGSPAEMCGNGARCFARYVRSLHQTPPSRVTFETGAGMIEAHFPDSEVSVNMTTPHSLQTGITVPTVSGNWIAHSINTGVPHLVCFVADVEAIDLRQLGSEMRFHPLFAPRGTNVNFVQIMGPNSISVRTYERGVEGETLACGTGVVASAILAHLVEGVSKPVEVRVRSGARMLVDFDHDGRGASNTRLQGPATVVFTGKIVLD